MKSLDYDEEFYDEAFSDGYDAGKRYSIAYTEMLEKRVAALKEALKPFSEYFIDNDDSDNDLREFQLLVGDIRKAKSLVELSK